MRQQSDPLTVEEILSACDLVGLAQLLDNGTRGRLEALLSVVNGSPHTRDSRRLALEQVGAVLARRLRMEADRREHPGIMTEEIVRPVFVVGFPRTGTTLLHSLLASDPGARAPRLWETRNPSPPPGLGDLDPTRVALGDADARAWCEFVPGLISAHPYFDLGAQTPIEDEEMMALDFQNAYPTWYPGVPTLLTGVGSSDPLAAYRFHREILQHLQWRRPPRRWVLKGTTHQFTLEALWSMYPDALCIWPHRAPSESMGSLLELVSMVNEAFVGPIDRPAFAEATIESIQAGLESVLASPVIEDPRLVHVSYPDLVSDPVATIARSYRAGDIELTATATQSMREWLADPANRSDRHGKFTYSLESFGLTRAEIDARFASYKQRFKV